jgi:hypothetical protein
MQKENMPKQQEYESFTVRKRICEACANQIITLNNMNQFKIKVVCIYSNKCEKLCVHKQIHTKNIACEMKITEYCLCDPIVEYIKNQMGQLIPNNLFFDFDSIPTIKI